MRRSMEQGKLQWLCLFICSFIMLNGKSVIGTSQVSNTVDHLLTTLQSTTNSKGKNATGGSQGSNMVKLTILESAISKGAVCLDGSPPAYYYDEGHGEGANNWIIYHRGGEWCYNVIDCLLRTKTEKGSSKLAEKERSFYGILSNNKTVNPDFYNWNRVMVLYCDGSSFTGDVEKVDPATKLHFRGARIFHAMIEHFLAKGMKNAKNAILTGSSAGGLPAILHCDRFRALLPNSARVKCLADGSYFLHKKNNKEMPFMETVNEGLISLHNSTKMLPESCTSKMNPSLCLFPQYFQQGIKTPFFIVNSMFDTFQINKTLPGYYDALMMNRCSASFAKTFRDFKQELLSALPEQSHSSSRGMFIDACFCHSQIVRDQFWNGSLTMYNKTIAEAFADWYFDRSPVQLIDKLDFPLNCYQFPSTNFCT